MVQTKVVSSNAREVVWLRRVREAEVFSKQYAVFLQRFDIRILFNLIVVLVFQPDCNEAVECFAGDNTGSCCRRRSGGEKEEEAHGAVGECQDARMLCVFQRRVLSLQ